MKPQDPSSPASIPDFQAFLRDCFQERTDRNPSYSLRSFARYLDVDASTLSKILSGKKNPGRRFIEKSGQRLGLNPDQIVSFHKYQKLKLHFPEGVRTEGGVADQRFHLHPDDEFRLISDWHHYAILELMRLDRFQPTFEWIARELGLGVFTVEEAVKRLLRVGVLSISPKGEWIDRSQEYSSSISGPYSLPAHRKHQRQILEQAIDALENIPFNQRHQSSNTFAADSARVALAGDIVKRFRRGLSRFLNESGRKDTVLQLSVSLFPVNKNISNERPKNGPKSRPKSRKENKNAPQEK